MERRKLTPDELTASLDSLDNWEYKGDHIEKNFKFADFAESLRMVNQVGAIAEECDHHPDISFGWGYAKIATTTHDRGGVTDVDIALAGKIDSIS